MGDILLRCDDPNLIHDKYLNNAPFCHDHLMPFFVSHFTRNLINRMIKAKLFKEDSEEKIFNQISPLYEQEFENAGLKQQDTE